VRQKPPVLNGGSGPTGWKMPAPFAREPDMTASFTGELPMARRRRVAGNWKLNGLRANLDELARMVEAAKAAPAACDILVCPPATLIAPAAEVVKDSPVALGGQDCHHAKSGAHTGDISAAMLKDLGCSHVIVGHSERRTDHK